MKAYMGMKGILLAASPVRDEARRWAAWSLGLHRTPDPLCSDAYKGLWFLANLTPEAKPRLECRSCYKSLYTETFFQGSEGPHDSSSWMGCSKTFPIASYYPYTIPNRNLSRRCRLRRVREGGDRARKRSGTGSPPINPEQVSLRSRSCNLT